MPSKHSSIKNFFILFALTASVLSLVLTGPFGFVLASSPYIPVFAQIIGQSGSGDGQFYAPGGAAVSANGTLYVSDTDNSRVEVFSAAGVYQRQIPDPNDANLKNLSLSSPRGLATDAAGNLYIADSGNNRIVVVTPSKTYTTWTVPGASAGTSESPYDVAVDKTRSLVYVVTASNRLQKFNLSGAQQSPGAWGGLNAPSGVDVDTDGNVYVADTNNHVIKKFSASGSLLATFGAYGTGNGQFVRPRGIALDSENTIYVADTNNDRIQKLSSSGVFIAKWGASGIAQGEFTRPYALAVNGADNVYIADTLNDRVQHFEPDTAPTNINISATSVEENLPARSEVGALSATDANQHDSFTYALAAGPGSADNAYFIIEGSKLLTAAPLSFDKAQYSICVQVTDSGGMTYQKAFSITVINVNDPPVVEDQNFPPFSEAAPNGTVVGQIAATDPDPGDASALTFTKTGGTGMDVFDVTADGQVVVSNSALLDFETKPILTLTVQAKDTGGLSDTGTLTLYLTDANDAPIPTPITVTVPENSPRGTLISDTPLVYTDEDRPAQAMTWEIIAAQPAEAFNAIRFYSEEGWGGYYTTSTKPNPKLYVFSQDLFNYEWIKTMTITIRLKDNGFPARYTDFTVTIHVSDVNEPPACNPQYQVWLPEHTPVVGTQPYDRIAVYDPEQKIDQWSIVGGDPIIKDNFELVPDPAGPDPKNGNSLAILRMKNPVDFNYEQAKSSYDVTIDVKDDAGYTCASAPYHPDQVTLKVSIYNIEEPPSFKDGAITAMAPYTTPTTPEFFNNNLPENFQVAEVQASDPDAFGNYSPYLMYDIVDGNPGPNNDKLFRMMVVDFIPPNEIYHNQKGIIYVNNRSLLDYETTPNHVYNLKVKATDRGGNSAFIDVPVTVLDINEPPQITRQTFYVLTNSTNGTLVGQLNIADPENNPFAVSLVPSGNDPFTVDPDGKIWVADETQMTEGAVYPLTVTATDTGEPQQSSQVTLEVRVSSVNNPPDMQDQSFSVNESTPDGTVVYTVQARDFEKNNITFTITGGDGQDALAVEANTGKISVKDATKLDYETVPNHKLTLEITATDDGPGNKSEDATITVNLTDVNEAPVVEATTFHVNENVLYGTLVGTLPASDQDLGTTLNFAIKGGNTEAAFSINQKGQLLVNNPTQFNYEALTKPYSLTIAVTDDGSPAITTTVTIPVVVDNVNEPGVIWPGDFDVNENSPAGTLVGTLVAYDVDNPPNKLIYKIVNGNDNGLFALDNTGKLTVNKSGVLDYEAKSQYTLTVQVSDDTPTPADSETAQVTIAVNNVNEAPVLDNNSLSLTVDDRSEVGTPLGGPKISAADPENDRLSYEIVGGNLDNAFDIRQDTGTFEVKTTSAVNFGKHPVFNLTVAVSDGSNAATLTATVLVIAHPDLAMTVSAPLNAMAGSPLNMKIRVQNIGYKPAARYALTIAVPEGLTFDPSHSWADCSLAHPEDPSARDVTCVGIGMAAQGYLDYDVSFNTSQYMIDGMQMPMSIWLEPTGEDWSTDNDTWDHTIMGWSDTFVLYEDTFDGAAGLSAFWKAGSSAPAVGSSPSGEKFAGAFNSGTQLTYVSDPLPAHQQVTIDFDLYTIGDWSGNQGPDRWEFRVGDQTLLDTTFSNLISAAQAYPAAYPAGNNPALSDSQAVNSLGYTRDATYHMTYTLNHTASTLMLSFIDHLPASQSKQWGIDNVKITVSNPVTSWSIYLPFTRK